MPADFYLMSDVVYFATPNHAPNSPRQCNPRWRVLLAAMYPYFLTSADRVKTVDKHVETFIVIHVNKCGCAGDSEIEDESENESDESGSE